MWSRSSQNICPQRTGGKEVDVVVDASEYEKINHFFSLVWVCLTVVTLNWDACLIHRNRGKFCGGMVLASDWMPFAMQLEIKASGNAPGTVFDGNGPISRHYNLAPTSLVGQEND